MKDQIIKFYKGLPGSGKSTLAKAWVDKDATNRVRVNKDSIRDLLHNGKYSKGNEKQVLDTQDFIILDSLKRGKSIAFDNTHLINKHLTRLENLLNDNNLSNVKIEVVDLTSVEPEECIKRDLKRANSVGSDVIWRMYWQNIVGEIKPSIYIPGALDCIIVDIDGTLAQMNGRHPFQWDKVGEDLCRTHIARLVEYYSYVYDQDTTVILMSGREDVCMNETMQWLAQHQVEYNILLMRPAGNYEKDTVLKERLYRDHIEGNYNVLLVVDDRPSVIRMWTKLGLPVVSANPTTWEF